METHPPAYYLRNKGTSAYDQIRAILRSLPEGEHISASDIARKMYHPFPSLGGGQRDPGKAFYAHVANPLNLMFKRGLVERQTLQREVGGGIIVFRAKPGATKWSREKKPMNEKEKDTSIIVRVRHDFALRIEEHENKIQQLKDALQGLELVYDDTEAPKAVEAPQPRQPRKTSRPRKTRKARATVESTKEDDEDEIKSSSESTTMEEEVMRPPPLPVRPAILEWRDRQSKLKE